MLPLLSMHLIGTTRLRPISVHRHRFHRRLDHSLCTDIEVSVQSHESPPRSHIAWRTEPKSDAHVEGDHNSESARVFCVRPGSYTFFPQGSRKATSSWSYRIKSQGHELVPWTKASSILHLHFNVECQRCPRSHYALIECDPGNKTRTPTGSVCAPCSEACPSGKFQVAECTAMHDRKCQKCSKCPYGTSTFVCRIVIY